MPGEPPTDVAAEHEPNLSQDPHLLRNRPRSRLVKILGMAYQNLNKELSPRHPLSVHTKACDLIRILPRWDRSIAAWLQLHGPDALSDEIGQRNEVYETAVTTARRLAQLVQSGVVEDELAEAEKLQLLQIVGKAILALVGAGPPDKRPTESLKDTTVMSHLLQEPVRPH